MRLRILAIAAIWVCMCVSVPLAGAQEQRGSIEGTVKDSSGGVLPGVLVEAKSPALVGSASTVTDARGAYAFPALPPGTYELTATLTGFTVTKVPNVGLTLGRTLRVDFTLAMETLAETVTVTGNSPLIDTTRSAVATSLVRKDFDLIPKGRDFTNIATLAPGANDETKLGGLSIDGASGAENVFYVDGADVTNLQRGLSGKSVIMDLIEEVQVKSSGYDAEYGGALGGVVSVVTRSGSNEFNGEGNVYFSGDALTAERNQALRIGLINPDIAESVRYPEDSVTLYEPGFMLGGPLRRDRLWFFGAYFPQLERTERTVTFLTTSETQTQKQTRRTQFLLGKVNAQLSSKIRGNFSYNINPTRTRGQLPGLAGTDNPNFPFATTGDNLRNSAYSGNVDWLASNKLYINLRSAYFAYDTQSIGVPTDPRWVFNQSNLLMPGIPDELRRPTGWSSTPTNSGTVKDLQTRLTFNADLTYTASWAGRHTLKGGFQIMRLGNDLLSGALADNIQLFWGQAYTARIDGLRHQGQYGYYTHVQSTQEGEVHSNNIALFVQDSWRVKRLTLNLGVRTEREYVPSFRERPEPPISFGFRDKLAPRLGATYDIRGDGKWKVYGGYGKFFDIMKLTLPRGLFGASRQLTYFRTLDTFNWPSLEPGNYPGNLIEVVDGRPDRSDTVDPAIKPVQSQEFSLGLEHELGARTSVGARYIRKQLVRTIEDTGWIGPTGSTQYWIANPGFGNTEYIMRNSFNQGGLPPDFPVPRLPKARRDYDAVEVRLTRRLAGWWSSNVSYTWSRLFGNYTGLVASDEINATTGGGRADPNASGAYDQQYNVMGPGSNGLCCSVPLYRHLPTDRPHQLKTQMVFLIGKGMSAGGNFYMASGTPVTRTFWKTNDIFFAGDMSEGRTPVYSQTDLNLRYEARVAGDRRLQLSLNLTNVFDQRTVTHIFFTVNKRATAVAFSDVEFFGTGFDAEQRIRDRNLSPDPRFLQPMFLQNPRAAIASVRLIF